MAIGQRSTNGISPFNKGYVLHLVFGAILFVCLGSFLKGIRIKDDDEVKIAVKLKAGQDDVFQLFYLPLEKAEYSDKNVLRIEAAGQDKWQTLEFSLPDTLQIKTLRLDLGNNIRQKQVQVKQIVVSYNHQQLILFDPLENINFFNINEFVEYDGRTDFNLLPPVQRIYDPYLYSRDLLAVYDTLLSSKKQFPFPFLTALILVSSVLVYTIRYVKPAGLKTSFYTFASCFFVFLLFLPSVNEIFGVSAEKNLEKREHAARPVLSAEGMLEYPKQFEAYYNDNFGFRSALVGLVGKIKYYVFNVSSIPSKCAVGKDGWLFLDGKFYCITERLTKSNLYKKAELYTVVAEWERRKQSLEKQGINYYKAFWPDKQYIYPEYMPYCMRVLNKDTITKCDQVINYLKEKGSVLDLLDVRQDLLSRKKEMLLYEKYDSHWNSYGAFIAYTALFNRISKDLPVLKPRSLSQFDLAWKNERAGDLSNLLNLDLYEPKPVFTAKKHWSGAIKVNVEGFPEKTMIIESLSSADTLTALIYRDSFTTALIPFFKLHFKKIVLLDASYSDDMVKKVGPDVVIEGYATRYFR